MNESYPSGTQEAAQESIKAAALRYKGEIFTGPTHADAVCVLEETYPDYRAREVEDGFVTSTGRYVDRDEALAIAQGKDQVKPGGPSDILDSNFLDSDKL